MNRFSSKISFIIITFFMFAIIVSFALTGFQGFDSSVDVVAKVDGTPVTIREYQNSLQAKVDNYSRIFGGKSLTAQQIRQFRLKESTLQELISQKLVNNLADTMSLNASEDEVKETIKNLPYFKTNDQFDVNKYKSLLIANRFTPSSFEKNIINDLKLRKISALISTLSVSNDFAKDILKFKKNSAITTAVEIERESLTQYLTISSNQIKDFLADEKNKTILESLYKSKQSQYNKPEQVRASHILLKTDGKNEAQVLKDASELRKKLTTKNFAKLADKKTQDPSGKGKGGSLGWFGKGRMVPEFENVAFKSKIGTISAPIKTQFGYHIIYVQDKKAAETKTLVQVQDELAKEHLQKSSRKELSTKIKEISEKIKKHLASNNQKALENLAKKYKLTLETKKELNIFDLKVGSIQLEEQDVKSIFASRDSNKIISKDTGSKAIIAKVINFKNEQSAIKEIEESLKNEVNAQNQKLNSEFNRNLVENLQNKANIATYSKML